MRYELSSISEAAAKRLSGDLSLHDEISLARMTVQDIVTLMDSSKDLGQRIMAGSMLRDAIELLSRLVERAARLPATPDHVTVQQVATMLEDIQSTIIDHLPDGAGRQQLIMSVKSRLEGISNRETNSAVVLRTCEAMDRSVPFIEFEEDVEVRPASEEDQDR
jgi:hypothetical protein